MSYNLMAEGDLDLFEFAQAASQFEPLELFPIPATDPHPVEHEGNRIKLEPDAIGVAIPRARVGTDAAGALRRFVELMWVKDVNVIDLYCGKRISTPQDLAEVEERIGG